MYFSHDTNCSVQGSRTKAKGRQRMDLLALLAVVSHYAEKEVRGYQHTQSYTLVPHQRGQNAP